MVKIDNNSSTRVKRAATRLFAEIEKADRVERAQEERHGRTVLGWNRGVGERQERLLVRELD